jgi:hypothetical protein
MTNDSRKNASLSDFRYVLFPAESPKEEWRDIYLDTYRVWRNVWTKTFQDLDGNGTLFSDDICRQSLIGSIMKGNQCAAIGMFHLVDFDCPTAVHDSWFKAWSDAAISKLLENGRKILVISNITVDPEFRGEIAPGIRLRDILALLCSKTILLTDADAWAGTARCNRGVDKACYAAGGTHIQYGTLHGVDVALVTANRNQVEALKLDFSVEALWRKRTLYQQSQLVLREAA